MAGRYPPRLPPQPPGATEASLPSTPAASASPPPPPRPSPPGPLRRPRAGMLAGGREGPGWGNSPGRELASHRSEVPSGPSGCSEGEGWGRGGGGGECRNLGTTPQVREGREEDQESGTRDLFGVILRQWAPPRAAAAHLPRQQHPGPDMTEPQSGRRGPMSGSAGPREGAQPSSSPAASSLSLGSAWGPSVAKAP